ncbi:mCG1044209 [Mus musculus]|nr:mCG1044209 [Mus musculus]
MSFLPWLGSHFWCTQVTFSKKVTYANSLVRPLKLVFPLGLKICRLNKFFCCYWGFAFKAKTIIILS